MISGISFLNDKQQRYWFRLDELPIYIYEVLFTELYPGNDLFVENLLGYAILFIFGLKFVFSGVDLHSNPP